MQIMRPSQQVSPSSLYHQRQRRAVVAVVVLAWLASCSLQDLDKLGPGNSNAGGAVSEGGTDSTGGTTSPTTGGSSTSGQAGAYAGQSSGNAGTVNSAAGTAGKSGIAGAVGKAGNAALGGAPPATGGAPTGSGGTTGIGGTTSRDSVCPTYTGTGGTLVTPPSNGFELDVSGWSTVAERVAAISRGQGGSNACEGSSYLACNGAMRQAGWDGPAINIFSSVVEGHTYAVTLAARFDPNNAPASAKSLRLVTAKYCSDSSVAIEYARVAEQLASFSWLRLNGTIQASLVGCPSLRRLVMYVETDEAELSNSLHVDDLRLYDMTAGSGGGAGGAGTAGGGSVLAGSAGMLSLTAAGTAGSGG